MRWTLLIGLALLAGCQGVVGPLQRRCKEEPLPTPCTPIDEQRAIERSRLPFGESSPAVGPRTFFDNPFTKGGN